MLPISKRTCSSDTICLVAAEKEVQETSWQGSGGAPQIQTSPKIGGLRGLIKTFSALSSGQNQEEGVMCGGKSKIASIFDGFGLLRRRITLSSMYSSWSM